MSPIKLIIFDLDGTLVDAYKAIAISFNFTMRKLKLPPQEPLVIRRSVGWGDEALLGPFVSRRLLKRALAIYRQHHKKSLLEHSRVFSATIRVLKYLRKERYKLAVASNRPTRFCWILIRHLKIDRFFDLVLCADKIKNYKPHPEILLRIISKLSCQPKQTLYVGDMTVDILAGRRAKVKTVGVLTGSSTRDEIINTKPWKIIKDISKLPELILK